MRRPNVVSALCAAVVLSFGAAAAAAPVAAQESGLQAERAAQAEQASGTVAVYRVYSPFSGEHLWTASVSETDGLVGRGWYDEGSAWKAPASGPVAVHRLFNPASGEHHYTADSNEIAVLGGRGWRDEGVLCYAASPKETSGDGAVAVYRLHEPKSGIHTLTTSAAERDSLTRAGWRSEGVAFRVAAEGEAKAWPSGAPGKVTKRWLYRLYHGGTGEHFYTSDAKEKAALVRAGWFDEGTAWASPSWSRIPVHRLYSPQLRDHHYTTDANEVAVLTSRYGWRDEGIGWYSSEQKEVAVYRQFNPGLLQGSHHYTTSRNEYDTNNARNGWRGEGVAWHAMATGNPSCAYGGPYTVRFPNALPVGLSVAQCVARGSADQRYGVRPFIPYAKYPGFHYGKDFGYECGVVHGANTYAAISGRITRATRNDGRLGIEGMFQGQKVWVRYSHLDTMTVNVGDIVRAGQKIGTVGQRELPQGPGMSHTHFEVWHGAVEPDWEHTGNSTGDGSIDSAQWLVANVGKVSGVAGECG